MPQPSGWGLASKAPQEHGPPERHLARDRLWLALGAALSAAVLTACDGGVTEPPFLPETSPTPTEEATPAPEPTPTAVPTPTAIPEPPTPPPESGGMDGFRAFAAPVETALADGDASFFADRGLEHEITCAGDEQLGPCVDQPAGTVVRGIPYGIAQSEGTFLPLDDYAAMLTDWFTDARPDLSDEYGGGGLALYALAHSPADAMGEEAYQAIVTGIFGSGPNAFRQARILSFQFLDGSWRLTFDLFATIPQTGADYLSGECSECFDHWERWKDTP